MSQEITPDYTKQVLDKSVELPKTYDFPTEIFDLPSKGLGYANDNILSSGELKLKYPSTKEEDILTSQNLIQKGIFIDEFLKSIIVDPINYKSLFIGDKNGILVAGRILLYGSDYKLSKITCTDCGNEEKNVIIDLNELIAKEVQSELLNRENVYKFKLPKSKIEIEYKLLTVADEEIITKEVNKLKKLKNDGVDHTGTIRIKTSILSINGDSRKHVIEQFFNTGQFLSQDSRAFKKEFYKLSPNIDMSTEYVCENCGSVHKIAVPMTTEFFWPE